MGQNEPRVVIGMDPHKRSVTIEVMTADETIVGGGRFDATVEGYAAMLEQVAAWPERCGRSTAQSQPGAALTSRDALSSVKWERCTWPADLARLSQHAELRPSSTGAAEL